MKLNILALIVAICISAVAAYFSVAGLTAIFSGTFIPIIIMGTTLEVGKIVTTVWLHNNWNKINLFIKYYLSVVVIVLMFITSLGIYGYLSKSHIEAASASGDNTLLIQQIDQNIAVEQKRIADNQTLIAQLDNSVNSLIASGTNNATKDNNRTATLAQQASKLRTSQKPERDAANHTIDETNARIQELNSQKLKLEQAQLKVEAEVGPIKYIAQLIYGDNVDKSLLERAVRWVIICIVGAFDPLAVSLVLGVTMSMGYMRNNKPQVEIVEREVITEVIKEVPVEVEKIVTVYNNEAIDRSLRLEDELKALQEERDLLFVAHTNEMNRADILEKNLEEIKNKEAANSTQITDSVTVNELSEVLNQLMTELEKKNKQIDDLRGVNVDIIGNDYPHIATTGQLFIITSQPNSLWKFNGKNWIKVDKNTNTSYTQNTNWQQWQLGRLQRAEIEWDDMTAAEQQTLEELV